MRIDTKKFLFVGMEEERERFFKEAQEKGIIHFIDFHPSRPKEVPEELQNISSAIKVLRGLPTTEQEEMEDYSKAPPIVDQILFLKADLDKLEERQRINTIEIARVEAFGDFSKEDIAYIEKEGDRVVQFFCARKGLEEEIPQDLIYINSDHGLDYYLSIAKERQFFDNMIEMQVDIPVGTLRKQKKEIEAKIHEKEHELKKFSKYNTFLHNTLITKLNDYHLNTAQTFPQEVLDGQLFAVEGWVPVDKISLLDELKVHFEEVAVGDEDVPPTYLENTGASRLGEDLVYIYDIPSNTDKDPSLWVLIFFTLFFAIIVGDGGYGIVYFLAGIFLAFRAKKITKLGKRVLTLVGVLCTATILWGVLTNSFFGINFAPDSPFRKVSLLQWIVNKKADYHLSEKDEVYNEWLVKFPEAGRANSYTEFLTSGVTVKNEKESYDILNKFADNILMELALLIGVVHVCLSFIRYLGRNWAGFGWILVIIGAYLYIPSYLGVTSMVHFVLGVDKGLAAQEGIYLLWGGFGIMMLLSVIQHKIWGITEVINAIQIFGDILSYLRLYALGLASAIVSVTVNELAGAMGPVFSIVVLVFGHSINMLLGIMGGLIHGLRLNFLEWYHYSFEGGGKLFAPLETKEIE